MCENPESKTVSQRLEHRLLIKTQRLEGKLEVDGRNAYFKGKAIPRELWRLQAFEMGLPADLYLEIAALAKDEAGSHTVKYGDRTYLVDVNGVVNSDYGPQSLVKSITVYQS